MRAKNNPPARKALRFSVILKDETRVKFRFWQQRVRGQKFVRIPQNEFRDIVRVVTQVYQTTKISHIPGLAICNPKDGFSFSGGCFYALDKIRPWFEKQGLWEDNYSRVIGALTGELRVYENRFQERLKAYQEKALETLEVELEKIKVEQVPEPRKVHCWICNAEKEIGVRCAECEPEKTSIWIPSSRFLEEEDF